MDFTFEKTALWQKTLAIRPNDPDKIARSRLRDAFLRTREAVIPLVAQIGKELPHLTVHDISHLDALWEVADLILGPKYPVTPAEAFVLGMTFLLHDAATSTVAYPDGINSICSTMEWNDFVAQKGWSIADVKQGEPKYQAALFEVLRILHPKHSEKLLTQNWIDLDGSQRFLLEDVQLRNHYGDAIGKIAHSHWWDISTVEATWANANPLSLQSSLSVASSQDWRVDRFKVALILRCADAAHIDGRRAPSMLASLVHPTGVSKTHWHFQNRLGLPSIDDRSELYWSAGQPFGPQDADAWWLCFDTAKMIDKEIRSSNRILVSNARDEFRAQGVGGAQVVSEFLQTVPVEGWYPIDVNFKVSRVNEVIEKFGGSKLYGAHPWRAVRELLQNAADAVRARRAKRNLPGSPGSVTVNLQEKSGAWWLEITDTGIGMSRYVLSEVLLDFGRSLWTDSALRSELPGLASSGFESVGQFGIGFLSIFMLGDEVNVTSWRDGDAEDRQSEVAPFV